MAIDWNRVSNTKGGLLKFHTIDRFHESPSEVVWIVEDKIGAIKGSKCTKKFVGTVRGDNWGVTTYLFDDISQLDFLILEEWIYYIKEV
jgi:hypothetical protein